MSGLCRAILLWMLLCLPTAASAAPPGAAHPRVNASEKRLLALCRGMYDPGPLEKQARATFTKISQAGLRQRLAPLLPKLKSDLVDYSSVAFVLAYYGVDPRQNVDRMLLPYVRWRRNPSVGAMVMDSLPHSLERVYRRRNEEFVLRQILGFQADGSISASMSSVKADLFLDSPNLVLRTAAGRRADLERLAISLWSESGDKKKSPRIRATLQKMAGSGDPQVARAARFCREDIQRRNQRYCQGVLDRARQWAVRVERGGARMRDCVGARRRCP